VTNLLDNTTHRNTQVLSKLIAIVVSEFLEWRANMRALYLDTLLATNNLRCPSDTNLAVYFDAKHSLMFLLLLGCFPYLCLSQA